MARIARAELVDPREVGIFHCMNRCVRQERLCGQDSRSGRNYDHRKEWLEGRFQFLAQIFAIDLLGYAILSNHFHVILRSRPDVAAGWSDTEVARRWWRLCPARRNLAGDPEEPTAAELDTIRNDPERLAAIRLRLSDISWWMRMAAEPIARRANREEEITGRFWEGRFKCVKLCDEAALLACMAYVDLNPIRAGIAPTPETSRYTSIHRRLQAKAKAPGADAHLVPIPLEELRPGPLPSANTGRASDKGCLPLTAREYIELVDWTGREVIPGKGGAIPKHLAPIFDRLQMDATHWGPVVEHFGQFFRRVAGAPQSLTQQVKFRRGRAELLART